MIDQNNFQNNCEATNNIQLNPSNILKDTNKINHDNNSPKINDIEYTKKQSLSNTFNRSNSHTYVSANLPNGSQSSKDFQNIFNYLDNLPQKLQHTNSNQLFAIQNKYMNLMNTMKPIRTLVEKYKKQLNNLMIELQDDNRINQLTKESNYFQKELGQLQKSYYQLYQEVEGKKIKYNQVLQKAKLARTNLNNLKIENLNLKIQIKQQKNNQTFKAKQIKKTEIQSVNKKQKSSNFSNQNQNNQTYNLTVIDQNTLEQSQQKFIKQIKRINIQNSNLQVQIIKQIQEKFHINELFLEMIENLRKILRKDQEIVHDQGLIGSMLFKLPSNNKTDQNSSTYNTYLSKRSSKSNLQHQQLKFLIYDALKNKYQKYKKGIQIKNSEYEINFEKFKNFTSLQTIGFMQLQKNDYDNNAFENIKNKIRDRKKQLLLILKSNQL